MQKLAGDCTTSIKQALVAWHSLKRLRLPGAGTKLAHRSTFGVPSAHSRNSHSERTSAAKYPAAMKTCACIEIATAGLISGSEGRGIKQILIRYEGHERDKKVWYLGDERCGSSVCLDGGPGRPLWDGGEACGPLPTVEKAGRSRKKPSIRGTNAIS